MSKASPSVRFKRLPPSPLSNLPISKQVGEPATQNTSLYPNLYFLMLNVPGKVCWPGWSSGPPMPTQAFAISLSTKTIHFDESTHFGFFVNSISSGVPSFRLWRALLRPPVGRLWPAKCSTRDRGKWGCHLSPELVEQRPREKQKREREELGLASLHSEGIVKQAKMSVREAMEQSLNGSKIMLRFNEELQAVGDGASLLSGILGALSSDYSKFPICEKSWGKVRGKDRVYDDCIKEMFHFQDNSGRIKKTLLKQMGRFWKDTRGRLYDSHYKPTRTLEQNLEKCPEGIPREHWRWFIDYHNDLATKLKCKQNALNRKKQLYTHTGGSKSLARAREEETAESHKQTSANI
ncbi:hypothetical protein Ahy_B05g074256 isoform B [Arachis hypogaea]|uniref:Uncharacterized protein n=1 Tax=Arachis hypogaea TaxID=3818 RepID=A0A444YYC8_ARAHY|nr:hypothetical protein Ahy_B05g074256 isoform B [Arachis hypogaea]